MKILPSLASADPMRLGESILALKGHPYLHFDIEDGNFVPNITFGMKTIRGAVKLCEAAMDAHLMVTEPRAYIDELGELGFAAVAFHWESTGYPLRVINRIRKYGMRAGAALNPATPVGEIFPYLDQLDYILLMSSEPDDNGEIFQELVLAKIRTLREASAGQLEIIVDGGIADEQYRKVRDAGATGVVMGRKIFQSADPLFTANSFQ